MNTIQIMKLILPQLEIIPIKSIALKIGVGYYGKSILDFINGYKKTPIKIVPIMGYQFQSSSFQAEAEVVFGLSDYHVFLFKIGREPDSTYGTIIKHDDIKT